MSVIGHGVDIVSVSRIQRLLDEHGDRFTHRCFGEAERRYCEQAHGRRAERYAVRFAAKEAVMKALGTGWAAGIEWTHIVIDRQPSGNPVLNLLGQAASLADSRGVQTWHVSLSHTDDMAMASVIASSAQGR